MSYLLFYLTENLTKKNAGEGRVQRVDNESELIERLEMQADDHEHEMEEMKKAMEEMKQRENENQYFLTEGIFIFWTSTRHFLDLNFYVVETLLKKYTTEVFVIKVKYF